MKTQISVYKKGEYNKSGRKAATTSNKHYKETQAKSAGGKESIFEIIDDRRRFGVVSSNVTPLFVLLPLLSHFNSPLTESIHSEPVITDTLLAFRYAI